MPNNWSNYRCLRNLRIYTNSNGIIYISIESKDNIQDWLLKLLISPGNAKKRWIG